MNPWRCAEKNKKNDRSLNHFDFHHRVNLPNSIVRHVLSTVALIFRSMAYIPERFADHCNDRRLAEGQLLRGARVKRKPCGSPTKNACANLAPLRFCKSPSSSTFSSTTRPVSANHL